MGMHPKREGGVWSIEKNQRTRGKKGEGSAQG